MGARYYVFGSPRLLDAPGEWVRDGDEILVQTADGTDLAAGALELKRRDYSFDLDERSYITLEGFEIFAATVTTDRQAGRGTRGIPTWRQDINDKSHHVVMDGLNFRYVSHFTDMSGHQIAQWMQSSGVILSGTDGVVKNSRIRYSAGNGIAALGARHGSSSSCCRWP